ncbi:MAG: paraquat-inducible protein A [Xanthobacteraceae bacterium]|nr:paraquat-inducible protein A [Xanthobacteraceae bacterium]QYK43939.1 MAG: paraquat-inducible protein A [Xanthobacteraceae bacterium]
MTAARAARGWQRLIGPLIVLHFALFCYVLFQPLVLTRITFFFRNEITLLQAAADLWRIDKVLFVVVALFGIAAPAAKMLAMAGVWYFADVKRAEIWNRWLMLLGRLAMLDIFLIAILIVLIKGTGVGSVTIRPGLYLYVALVAGFFFLSLAVERLLRQFQEKK